MNSNNKLIVFGAGGHGKVVSDAAARSGYSIVGFADDTAALHGATVLGHRVLGGRRWLSEAGRSDFHVALGIGDNTVRKTLLHWLLSQGFTVETIVSPLAVIAPSVFIGRGSVVMPGCVITADAVIGEGVIVNTAAIVEHDVTTGECVHLSPNATLGGGVRIGELTHIGIGATVLPLVKIGARSILGAGSVAPRDIPDDVIAFGSPARVQRSMGFKEKPVGRLRISKGSRA